jgi:hypothetical protein
MENGGFPEVGSRPAGAGRSANASAIPLEATKEEPLADPTPEPSTRYLP